MFSFSLLMNKHNIFQVAHVCDNGKITLRLMIGFTGVFTEILRTRASFDETTENDILM